MVPYVIHPAKLYSSKGVYKDLFWKPCFNNSEILFWSLQIFYEAHVFFFFSLFRWTVLNNEKGLLISMSNDLPTWEYDV